MMNNIGTLYTYELKKIANRKLVWIVGMIMIALSMFLSVSDLVTSSSYYGETSVSAYQAMKFNKDNAEELSGMAIDDTLLREMQEDCANESKDHTKSQAVTSNNQIAIDIGVGSDDTESSVLKKYFPIYSYVQQITDDDSLTLSINSNELYAMRKKLISDNRADQMLNEDEYNDWNSKEILMCSQSSIIEKQTQSFCAASMGKSNYLDESFNRFLIISLDVLICRYSPLFRAFPALFISEEPHKSFYYPSCFHSQK